MSWAVLLSVAMPQLVRYSLAVELPYRKKRVQVPSRWSVADLLVATLAQ
jgi:hypothetical protein